MQLINCNWYSIDWKPNKKKIVIPSSGITLKDIEQLPIKEGVYYILKESDFLRCNRTDIITQDYASAVNNIRGQAKWFKSFIMKPIQE